MAKREEKINQLLKLMDQGLHRFISSQQRYLQLETGTFISISSQVRLVAEDSNWMTFEEILGQESEEPEFYSDHLITTHQRLFEEEVHRLETAFKRTVCMQCLTAYRILTLSMCERTFINFFSPRLWVPVAYFATTFAAQQIRLYFGREDSTLHEAMRHS